MYVCISAGQVDRRPLARGIECRVVMFSRASAKKEKLSPRERERGKKRRAAFERRKMNSQLRRRRRRRSCCTSSIHVNEDTCARIYYKSYRAAAGAAILLFFHLSLADIFGPYIRTARDVGVSCFLILFIYIYCRAVPFKYTQSRGISTSTSSTAEVYL